MLKFVHYNFVDCGRETEYAYKIYRAFMKVWPVEYKVIDNYDKIHSDYFLQHEAVNCIEYNGEIIAGLFTRYTNLRNPIHRDQSFFEEWPNDVLDDLAKRYEDLIIGGHFFVVPEYRSRPLEGHSVANTLIACSFMHFNLVGNEEALIAALRNDRGVNSLCRRNGSRMLRNVNLRNLDVDLVEFNRQDLTPVVAKYKENIVKLYNERIIYGSGRVSSFVRQEDGKAFRGLEKVPA